MLNYFIFFITLFSFPHASEYFTNLRGDCNIIDNKIYSANFPGDFKTPNLCRFEVQKDGWIATTDLSLNNVEVVIGRDIYPSLWTHDLSEPIDQQVWQYDVIQVMAMSDSEAGTFVLEFVEDQCNQSELFALFNKLFYVNQDCTDPFMNIDEVCVCLSTIEPREAERFDCMWNLHSWNPKHVLSVAEHCRNTACTGTSCSCDVDIIRAEIPTWIANYGQQIEEPCNTMVDSMDSGIFSDQVICSCFNELPSDLSFVLGCTFDELGLSFAAKAKECRGYSDPTISPSATLPSTYPSQLPTLSPSSSPSSTLPTSTPTASEPSLAPVTSIPSSFPSTRPSLSSPSHSPTISFPSQTPTTTPTISQPTSHPLTSLPTASPSGLPSHSPSLSPITTLPSINPITSLPSQSPSSTEPSFSPSNSFPSTNPSYSPSSSIPSESPSVSSPSTRPTSFPSFTPSSRPSMLPTSFPSCPPSSNIPTASPSKVPSNGPIPAFPSTSPSSSPTPNFPTASPSSTPTSSNPSQIPTTTPSKIPSANPTTDQPSAFPFSSFPTTTPSRTPTSAAPTVQPSSNPTVQPSFNPSTTPSRAPTSTLPSVQPSNPPTISQPSLSPSTPPTNAPSFTTPTVGPSRSPTETLYEDQIVLDEDFSVVENVTTFCNECTAFLRTIPAVSKVSCTNAVAGSIIIDIEGPEAQNRIAKDYVAAFGMNLTCCGVLGGMEIQTSVVIETSLVEVETRISEEESENSFMTFGMYGLAGALFLVISGVVVWCCFCKPKSHIVKFIEEDNIKVQSESEDIITNFSEKREPMTSKREPHTAKREPQTIEGVKASEEKPKPKLMNLVMDNVTHSEVSITPRSTIAPPIPTEKQVDMEDLPQEGAEYDYDDCGGDSMQLLPLFDREFEEALEFDPEFVYLKDQIASLLGQAAKFEPGAIRSQWEAQAQFSKDALLKLCRIRFGDERTDNYKPRLERIWRETSEVARRLSVTSVRGLFFKFFDISNDGDITAEDFKSIALMIMPDIEPYAIDETFRFIDTSNRGAFTPIEIQTFLDKQWGGRARKFRKAVIEYMSTHSIQETHEALEPKLKRAPEINLDTNSFEEEDLNIEDTELFGQNLLEKMRQLRQDMDNRRLSTAFDDGYEDEDDVREQMQHSSLSSLEAIKETEFLSTDTEDTDMSNLSQSQESDHATLQGTNADETYLERNENNEPEEPDIDDLEEGERYGTVNLDAFDSESEELSSLEASPVIRGMHVSKTSASVHEVNFDLGSATI